MQLKKNKERMGVIITIYSPQRILMGGDFKLNQKIFLLPGMMNGFQAVFCC